MVYLLRIHFTQHGVWKNWAIKRFKYSDKLKSVKLGHGSLVFVKALRKAVYSEFCINSKHGIFLIFCIYRIYCVKIKFLFSWNTHSDLNLNQIYDYDYGMQGLFFVSYNYSLNCIKKEDLLEKWSKVTWKYSSRFVSVTLLCRSCLLSRSVSSVFGNLYYSSQKQSEGNCKEKQIRGRPDSLLFDPQPNLH